MRFLNYGKSGFWELYFPGFPKNTTATMTSRRNNTNRNNNRIGNDLYRLFQLSVVFFMIMHMYMEHINYHDSLLSSSVSSSSEQQDNFAFLPSSLEIPKGHAVALPSIRINENNDTTNNGGKKINRRIYGGKGDKPHLGGFTEYDGQGVSPAVWKWMVEYLGVKTLLDVGCGKGISTSWFVTHGIDTYCVEGSHDAVQQTILPDPSRVTEHDFSRGPWWPPTTVDAVWCVEFLEHVGRNFHQNYMPAFRKAAIILVTHSLWGGWHHVEVHDNDWWIQKFEMYGFRYSDSLSKKIQNLAAIEANDASAIGPDGKTLYPQHIFVSMKAFINPAVASLPQHAHLLAEHGCYGGKKEGNIAIHRRCNTTDGVKYDHNEESELPESYHAIQLTPEMDQVWLNLIQSHIDFSKVPP